MRRVFLAGVALLALALPVDSAEITQEASAALVGLNHDFIRAHAVANEIDLATGGPIILLRDEELVLIRNGTESPAQVILPEYQTFKTFAHLPVAIYLMLNPAGGGRLDAGQLERLDGYRAKLERVGETIEQIGLAGPPLNRQKKMLGASQRFLDKVLRRQQCSTEELYAFTRSMTPMIKANLAGAARSQLDAMHSQVMAWKNDLTAEEWKKLRVSINGAVLARDDNLAKQYFERLLHLEGDGVRLTYMELYFPPTPMLTLLATRSVDRGISIAIFDDPDRMFRDVLADAAAAYIKKMNFDE